ncbi:MAG: hypothetical protein R3E48_08595 [Burkholderiaceae bacterium]
MSLERQGLEYQNRFLGAGSGKYSIDGIMVRVDACRLQQGGAGKGEKGLFDSIQRRSEGGFSVREGLGLLQQLAGLKFGRCHCRDSGVSRT